MRLASAPESFALLGAGLLFLTALITGAWKYAQIRRSSTSSAHAYVDIAHRAALLYSFAALLLARFAEISRLDPRLEVAAVAVQLLFFIASVFAYIVHGLLRDTDNQFARPHRLGPLILPAAAMTAFMAALIIAEIGGFLVLFYGMACALLGG